MKNKFFTDKFVLTPKFAGVGSMEDCYAAGADIAGSMIATIFALTVVIPAIVLHFFNSGTVVERLRTVE